MLLQRALPRLFARAAPASSGLVAGRVRFSNTPDEGKWGEKVLLPENYKDDTGITGLPVVPNARQVLIKIYERTLDEVARLIPDPEAPYRADVEAITKHRLKIVQEERLHSRIEERIGAGQVEQLIEMADDELELVPLAAEWKLWEDEPGREIPIRVIQDSSMDAPPYSDDREAPKEGAQ
eukprot:TRINITY_DN4564_c0_g1_i1.p1 TRINITY_DN4564_c0_g1~~TRINITY_DN4564_c0_g1_i1.p1  ORF type:complete len:209 (-),score=76.21 TRINITY_DN4564_c0_g1_i1:380-919(-)